MLRKLSLAFSLAVNTAGTTSSISYNLGANSFIEDKATRFTSDLDILGTSDDLPRLIESCLRLRAALDEPARG